LKLAIRRFSPVKIPMGRSTVFAALLLAGVISSCALPASAAPYHLRIAPLAGESVDAGHAGWIDVYSYSWPSAPPMAPAGPAPAGVVKGGPGSVTLVKMVDKASAAFQNATAQGTSFPSATVDVGGGRSYELKNVLVSSVTGGRVVNGKPAEHVALTFSAIELHYPALSTPTPRNWNAGDAKTEGGIGPSGTAAGAASGLLSVAPAVTKVTPSAASVRPGGTVTFTVEGRGDCNRSRIDFGDGSPVVEYPMVAGKSQPAPAHAYAKDGSYEVKAWGLADPWAKLKTEPKPSDHFCGGHATTSVVVKSPAAVVAPAFRR
jgi:type VI secretion system secreted protein Hcp